MLIKISLTVDLVVHSSRFVSAQTEFFTSSLYISSPAILLVNPRSFYFVKMLLLMVRYDFDSVKTKSIANKFFIKLNHCKLGNQGELETLEVIPYDILWIDLMEKLEKKYDSSKEVLSPITLNKIPSA